MGITCNRVYHRRGEHIHDFDCILIGAGDYRGLRLMQRIGGGDTMPWELTGQIETFRAAS